MPGDNSIDMYTNDIGLVTIVDSNGELEGFNVAVGGWVERRCVVRPHAACCLPLVAYECTLSRVASQVGVPYAQLILVIGEACF